MLIHVNQTGEQENRFYFGNRNRAEGQNTKTEGNGGKVISAGTLNLQEDPIMSRKAQALKKARDLINDAFQSDNELDDVVSESRERIAKLEKNALESDAQVRDLKDKKEELRESMGVSLDSEEHKDLEILEKMQKGTEPLTKEEIDRLQEMGPLTEYQEEALVYDDMINTIEKEAEGYKNQMIGEHQMIESISLERLKYHGMTDAQRDAGDIVQRASKQAAFELLGEAKEHIDEKLQENKEKIEESKKEKEEEEKLEEKKEAQKEQSAGEPPREMEEVAFSDSKQDKLKQELQELVQEQNLLAEDLKGLSFDQQI